MKRITNEHIVYFLIFLLGLLLRFVYLGAVPLSNNEAIWALDALHISPGSATELHADPFYILWTAVLFFVFGDNNFWARFLEALSGTALIGLPIFLRPWIGKRAALIFAAGLALDPSLLAASRIAGGPMISICLLFFAIAAILYRKKTLSVLLIAISLLTGVHILHGLIGISIALGIIWVMSRLGWVHPSFFDAVHNQKLEPQKFPYLSSVDWLIVLGTFIAVGTFFLRYPAGIAAFGNTFSSYFASWGASTLISPLHLMGMFFINEMLIICIGSLGFVRAWFQPNTFQKLVGIGSSVFFLWLLAYPQREPLYLAWIAVPLWALTATEVVTWIERYFNEDKFAALAHSGLILLLMGLIWINLAGLTLPQPNEEVFRTRWILLMGVVALTILSTLLVGLGWSVKAAKFGLLAGTSISLLFYLIGTGRAIVFPRSIGEGDPFTVGGVYEQWLNESASAEMPYLLKSLEDIAEWKNGHRRFIDVAVINPQLECPACPMPPAINWALRGFSKVIYLPQFSREMNYSVILTSIKQPTPNLSSAYRGQSFTLLTYPDWQQMSFTTWLNYFVHREMPTNQEQFILWVKDQLLTKKLKE